MGYIYRLYSDCDDMIYVGSTSETLEMRLKNHQNQVRANNQSRVHQHFLNIGLDHMHIEVLEEVYAIDEENLRMHERKWYDRLKPQLNMVRPWASEEEQEEAARAYCREYMTQRRAENPEAVKATWQKYYESHKDELNARSRHWYNDHKHETAEANRARAKAYRDANLEEVRQKDRERLAANREAINARRRERYAAKKAASASTST